jgi:type I restriction enzyme M protein
MEDLEKVISSIRNILRGDGITGMESINHCIVFLICRMLDEDLCEKVNINKKFAFDNLTKDDDGEELKNQELYDKFYRRIRNKNTSEDLVGEIVNKLKFRNIKFKIEGPQNLRLIIDKLKKLDIKKISSTYDVIGTIYEIHLKSGTSNAMRDLGQYYTNRLVIKYMIDLCEPKMIDGKIERIVDPTMGTGGFLTMAIKYLNDKYKKIKWNKNKDNIIGFDIDENVRNMALMNVFLETGELCSQTLVKQDTLRNDMKFTSEKSTILEKADIILANEPMGLKNIIHADCCDRIKNLKLRGTTAEPLFLQLFMEALDDNGRCAVIVPDGMLFNEGKQHVGTRKYLMENFCFKKVVSLNDDFFLNTGVKTSILFFVNNGYQTSKVEFSEIKLKDNEIEEKSILKVKICDIEKNNYSLFVNKYIISVDEKIEGMRYEKINDICDIQFGKRIKRDNVEITDDYMGEKYPCYGGGDISFYMKEYNREGFNIVISRFGISEKCVRLIDCKFWLNDSGFTLKSNNENILNTKYLGYYFHVEMQKKIYSMSCGACQKNLQMDNFRSIEIPVPSLSAQNKIVERFDAIKNSIKNRGIEYKKILKKYMMLLMCGDTLNEEYISICELLDLEKKLCDDDEKIKQIIKSII